MTTIKSFTDIPQSKKLAKILPIESADMIFQLGEDMFADSIRVPLTKEHWEQMIPDINPCWSLAALISILPRFIEFKGDKYYLRFMKEYVEYANDEISITGRCLHTTGNDNLVDAVVDMIIKLHGQNLL